MCFRRQSGRISLEFTSVGFWQKKKQKQKRENTKESHLFPTQLMLIESVVSPSGQIDWALIGIRG
jgi:hypothetical protein